MVGIASSGKIIYARVKFPGHAHVSLDTNKRLLSSHGRQMLVVRYTKEDPLCLEQLLSRVVPNPADPKHGGALSKAQGSKSRKVEYVQMADALAVDRDVVVDDTSLTRELWWPYILLARRYAATVRVVFFKNVKRAYAQNRKRRNGRD